MGTLRKMGAFLGLVPDDHQRYDREQDGDYSASGEYEDHTGRDGSPDASYDAALHENAVHDDPSYGGSPSYAEGDGARDPSVGYEYAGRSADTYETTADAVAHERAPRGIAPHGGDREPVFAGASPSGRSSRSAGGRSDTDYRTQGSLAVQPEARIEPPVTVETAGNQKPATVSLTGFADAREVGEFYRQGQAVILDMTDLTDAEARRMVDFAAGLAFAVRGSIDKVTTKVFMLHPPAAETDR